VAAPQLKWARGEAGALALVCVCLTLGCQHESSTTPSAPTPVPSPSAASTPSPSTLPPAPTQPVSLAVKLNPNPPSGAAPFTLNVSLCGSRPVPPVDGYPLTFTLAWGDGRRHTRYFCRDDHTYDTPGVYQATFCAADGIDGHESCASFRVKVD
jgi:hypothetical protein